MDAHLVQSVTQWIALHQYLLLVVAILAQGPLAILSAAIAAGSGVIDPLAVIVVGFATNMIGDICCFTIGHFGRLVVFEGYEKKKGVSTRGVQFVENLAKMHLGEAVLLLKVLPVVGLAGLMLVGALRITYEKYLLVATTVNSVYCAVLVASGYFFGRYILVLPHRGFVLAVVAVVFISLYGAYVVVSHRLAQRA